MDIKELKDLIDLLGRLPLRLVASLLNVDLRQPTDLRSDISVGDILDDVRHDATGDEPDARVETTGGATVPGAHRQHPPAMTWSTLWAYARVLPAHRYYAVAVSVLPLSLTAYTIMLFVRNQPVPTPIFAGAVAGWLALPAVRSVHQATRGFEFIETMTLCLSALLMVACGLLELLDQLDDLHALAAPSRAQRACLGIPIGMMWLGAVLGIVAKYGTTGRRRQLAFPAWVAITVGCIGTYQHTHAENNLILALGSVFAAAIAARPRRRDS